MFCPECGGEYREGFFECADCGVPLAATPPAPAEPAAVPDVEIVTVLATGDAGGIAVAESLLIDAGIPYLKKGDGLQDLFALGRFGFGFSAIAGPVTLEVPRDQAGTAAEILRELAAADGDPEPLAEPD
jgi:hypothetical protein